MVRVRVDIATDKTFDYLVPEPLGDQVRVGTRVRVVLHGRRVAGWVVDDQVTPPPGVELRPLSRVTGWGPPADLVALAQWAAWRWAGRPARFLRAASPPKVVAALPDLSGPPGAARPHGDETSDERSDHLTAEALATGDRVVVRLPPAHDPFSLVATAASADATLVLSPSTAEAARLAARLAEAGVRVARLPDDWAAAAAGAGVVAGARTAAWAPMPRLDTVVVLDAHDERYQDERAPTWSAVEVAAERARRAGARCLLVSPCPPLEALDWGRLVVPSRREERAGWAPLEVVDRRGEDPAAGLYTPRLVSLLRHADRVVCVLNRKGRARLLACAGCGELARCERCHGGLAQEAGAADAPLRCRRCGHERPPVCARCGSGRLKVLRPGVARVREELAALCGREVGEVTGGSGMIPDTPVLVGTEAVLHRVERVDGVAFLDFDQEMLAPRYRAAEEALALLARASRLVGGRAGGRVLVQTRVPRNDVLEAALHADPDRLARPERARRAELRLPPATALALLLGEAAPAFAAGLAELPDRLSTVEVRGPNEGRFLVRAPDHQVLCDALASVSRPPGRLRIEVDPRRA